MYQDIIDASYHTFTWLSIGITFAFGFCFIFLKIPEIPALQSYKKVRWTMAAAYLSLSVLNIVEIVTRDEVPDMDLTQSIVLVMSAFQALLYTYTFITLINLHFMVWKKILWEIGIIILLSILLFIAFLWNSKHVGFTIIFYVFSVYYISMLIRYMVIFLKNYRQYMYQVDNYFSDEETARLRWVLYTFFAALAVGIGALSLTFSETTIHYILFTIVFICFYAYFGIKFIDYAFFFSKIESVVTEEITMQKMKNQHLSDAEIEAKIDYWIQQKGFAVQGITIEQLSRDLATNRTYLSKHINSRYEKTFNEWINDLRIDEAQKLLQDNPELTMGEISGKVGYASQSHFGRQFSQRTGYTPRNWTIER
jgi:AraC-like DNA-binding protein